MATVEKSGTLTTGRVGLNVSALERSVRSSGDAP
jgi:hypothetical protein